MGWPGAYLFVYNDHNDHLHCSSCHVPLEHKGATGTGRWGRGKICMQWHLRNDRFGILISDIFLWVFKFGCAVLALPWQFQQFLLLNQFVCVLLLVLPPKSVCPWAWNLLAKAAPGVRSHCFPSRWSMARQLLWGVWSSRLPSGCVCGMRRHWTDYFGFTLTYLLSILKWLLLEGLCSFFLFPNYQSALCLCRCPCLSIPQSQQSKCDAASFWVLRPCSSVICFSWKIR